MAQGAGGGVAGVGVCLLAARGALFVELGEARFGEIDFAAHFKPAGDVLAQQGEGDALDGSQVERDVFAHKPVAARGAAREHAVFVGERHRQAVKLELAYHIKGVAL